MLGVNKEQSNSEKAEAHGKRGNVLYVSDESDDHVTRKRAAIPSSDQKEYKKPAVGVSRAEDSENLDASKEAVTPNWTPQNATPQNNFRTNQVQNGHQSQESELQHIAHETNDIDSDIRAREKFLKGEKHNIFTDESEAREFPEFNDDSILNGDFLGMKPLTYGLYKKNTVSSSVDEVIRKELENLNKLARTFRRKYENLEAASTAQARDNFAKYKIATSERIQACEEYSEYLEKQVERFESESLKKDEQLKAEIERKECALRGLEQMTAKVKNLEKSLERVKHFHDETVAGLKSRARKSSLNEIYGDRESSLKQKLEESNDILKNALLEAEKHNTAAEREHKMYKELEIKYQNVNEKNSKLERMVKLYEELTEVKIMEVENLYAQDKFPGIDSMLDYTMKSDNSNYKAFEQNQATDSLVFWCKHQGKKKSLEYNLIIPAKIFSESESPSGKHERNIMNIDKYNEVYVYKPINTDSDDSDKENRQPMDPKYRSNEWYKTSVEFERKMANLFFLRLSSHLQDHN